MQKFNVLDRSLNLHQHYLLEASAGTGKTFSIQNIVVRLLIESQDKEEPLLFSQILVVTFTRAAVRDLKFRIRSNIEQALLHLQEWLSQGTMHDAVPDYLRACMEQGEETVQRARKCLQQALFAFDQGQILTIHAFCGRMLKQFALESDWGFHSFSNEEPLPQSEVLAIIRDFFRTEIRLEQYSPAQLDILLTRDPDQRKLLKILQSRYSFPSLPSFKESYEAFVESMTLLKRCLSLNAEKMLEDFQNQAAFYRNFKSGETKAETLNKVSRFARLCDQEEWSVEDFDVLLVDDLVWIKALNPQLLKGTPPSPSQLHYPSLTQELEKHLKPILRGAAEFSVLLARLAANCQKLLKRYQREEEKLSPDDLLVKMGETLDRSDFLLQVQSHYRAAIIDEFQDTDPLQWQIFQRLFLSDRYPWKGYLYLVGDPKQSIYSFRQADVYTYLAAAQVLGKEHCFSLDVNYRSQPRLVRALNLLFSADHLPQFIPLPKHSFHLPYQPVQAGQVNQEQGDGERGAIHFFLADGQAFKKGKFADLETRVFFPFIAQEIALLRAKKGFAFRQFAVLVRDRHQALRLAEFFDQCQIPYLNQRGMSLVDSPSLQGLKDLLRAILHPYSRGAICTALGSTLIGWTQEELRQWEEKEFILIAIQHLRFCLLEKGFASFFEEMLRTSFRPNGKSVLASLLSRQEGSDLYRDLQQIADLIVDHQYKEWSSPEGILPFLNQLSIWEANEDERIKRFQDPSVDGVKILTLHFSKGLEFDIVFALGLANRTSVKEELIPVAAEGQLTLMPLEEDAEEYQHFYEENDAEKMRQLYVALTRAKYQLYIPIPLHLPSDHLEKGEASPIDLFLARLAQPPASWQELYERIRSYTGQSLIQWIEEKGQAGGEISYSLHPPISFERPVERELFSPEPLFAPPSVSLSSQPLWMASFSTLSYHAEHAVNERLSLVGSFPKDFDCPLKTVYTLPANRETGLLIHEILEKISFEKFDSLVAPEEALPLIRPFIRNTLFKEWEKAIAELIFMTLKTPLPTLSNQFSLASLSPLHFYREIPFLFPCKKGEELEGIQFQEGFIKGVIDLLFYHEGMYYLVDWKTNWLGGASENYEASFLQAAMQENAYFLQAAIYTEAIKRYLRLIESRPFEECFGGAFYLFLRGLSPKGGTGIYLDFATFKTLDLSTV